MSSRPAPVNPDDLRLGDALLSLAQFNSSPTTSDSGSPHVFILGFPFDEGTRRNGGRVGGSGGPAVVRRLLQRMGTLCNPETGADLRKLVIIDAGDIGTDHPVNAEDSGGDSLLAVHGVLTSTLCQLVFSRPNSIPVLVGGSNDQSFPNALALLQTLARSPSSPSRSFGCVNIDAHFDVRPLKFGQPHSGSPFRLMLEHPLFKEMRGKFVEFASQGNQCSQDHFDYLCSHHVPVHFLSAIRAKQQDGTPVHKQFTEVLNSLGTDVFVSFDIDSIQGSDCPGVSCPATIGLTADEALLMAFEAGKHPNVRMIDFSEYCPAAEEYRTGRLIVNLIYWFLMGVAKRS